MLKNYFKIAWRSLMRNKVYAGINIAGLSVGIASAMLIFLVIQFEKSFDDFHANKDRLYRVITIDERNGGNNFITGVPFPTAQALRLDYPQLSGVTSVFRASGQITVPRGAALEANKFKEKNTFFTDAEFFRMFSIGWLAGDKKTALAEPNTVALAQTTAVKYFGSWENAMGKTIR